MDKVHLWGDIVKREEKGEEKEKEGELKRKKRKG